MGFNSFYQIRIYFLMNYKILTFYIIILFRVAKEKIKTVFTDQNAHL